MKYAVKGVEAAAGLVLASFNAAYKLDAAVLRAWILAASVPASGPTAHRAGAGNSSRNHSSRVAPAQLWVIVRGADAAAGVRRAFDQLAPSDVQLVVTEPLDAAAHISAKSCADVFVDTCGPSTHTPPALPSDVLSKRMYSAYCQARFQRDT
jgi:hypothetical protein